jgi:hypothetical protein
MDTYEEFEHQCFYCTYVLFRSFEIDIDSLTSHLCVTDKGQQFVRCPNCKLKNLIRNPYNESGKLISKIVDY